MTAGLGKHQNLPWSYSLYNMLSCHKTRSPQVYDRHLQWLWSGHRSGRHVGWLHQVCCRDNSEAGVYIRDRHVRGRLWHEVIRLQGSTACVWHWRSRYKVEGMSAGRQTLMIQVNGVMICRLLVAHLRTFGDCAFSKLAPVLWNFLKLHTLINCGHLSTENWSEQTEGLKHCFEILLGIWGKQYSIIISCSYILCLTNLCNDITKFFCLKHYQLHCLNAAIFLPFYQIKLFIYFEHWHHRPGSLFFRLLFWSCLQMSSILIIYPCCLLFRTKWLSPM